MRLGHGHGHHRATVVDRARRGEAGAVLILVSLCLTVLVTAVAFTVDLGRISTTRRDLQKTADVVALDLARRLDGRTTAQLVASGDLDTAMTASLARNGFAVGGARLATRAIGHWDNVDQVFTPTAGAEVPDAVRVTLTDRVEFAFAPGGSTTSRTGVAANSARASFMIGSYAARVDSSTSPILQPILGDILGVTAGGYAGLVGGQVELGPFLGELGLTLGSPADVLAAEATLAQVIQAQADVLRAGGDVARADLLDQTVLNLPNPNTVIPLADLLELGVGTDEAAASTRIDAFDLLTSTAFIANGDAFVDVPNLGLNVLGLTSLQTQVQVIQRPAIVIGGVVGSSARTSQVRVRLALDGGQLGLLPLDLDLTLESASATGTITAIGCGTPEMLDLDVRTGLLTVDADLAVDASIRLGLVTVPLRVPIEVASSQAGTGRSFAFDFPPDQFGVARQVATPGLNLAQASVTLGALNVAGLPVNLVSGLTNGLLSTVTTSLLPTLDASVLTPLLRSLGATVAGADVTPLDVACNGTQLVG